MRLSLSFLLYGDIIWKTEEIRHIFLLLLVSNSSNFCSHEIFHLKCISAMTMNPFIIRYCGRPASQVQRQTKYVVSSFMAKGNQNENYFYSLSILVGVIDTMITVISSLSSCYLDPHSLQQAIKRLNLPCSPFSLCPLPPLHLFPSFHQ